LAKSSLKTAKALALKRPESEQLLKSKYVEIAIHEQEKNLVFVRKSNWQKPQRLLPRHNH